MGKNFLRRLWNSLPVRWQIMMAIAVLSMLAGGIVGAAAIIDARSRAQVEVTASLELAGRLMKESAARLTPDITPEDLFTRLYRQLQHHRHIDLAVTDAEGRTYDASGLKEPLDHQSARAPRWFSALVAPKAMTAEIRVAISGTNTARVTLTGNPDDEIAEVWNDLWRLMAFWTSANAVMMAALYLVLGRIFDPLVELRNGLRDLQDGDYSARVRTPKAVELASIAQSFNALATVLDASRDENRRLYRDLISVQESERRQIASELHDEFGPCLFGLSANTASIATVCEALEHGARSEIVDRAVQIQSIVARLKVMTRGLLKRLRPEVLGQVSLASLIGDLIADFEHQHPSVEFDRNIATLSRTYGDDTDLTIYRCVQEGITNAIRHGQANRVSIRLEEKKGDASKPGVLALSLEDNGTGIAPETNDGYGLTTMRERVVALGGAFRVAQASPGGATVKVSIPLDMNATRAPQLVVETA